MRRDRGGPAARRPVRSHTLIKRRRRPPERAQCREVAACAGELRHLREELASLRAVADILERLPVAVVAADEASRCTYANGEAERLLGRTREDLLGRYLWRELSPDSRTPDEAAVRLADEGQGPDTPEYLRSIDGRPIEAVVYPIRGGVAAKLHSVPLTDAVAEPQPAGGHEPRGPAESPSGAVAGGREAVLAEPAGVADPRAGRSELESGAERDLTAEVIYAAASLMVVLDQQGLVARFNRTCERTTGYSFGEVKGVPIWSFVALAEEAGALKAVVASLSAGHAGRQEVETHWLTKKGDCRLISWTFLPLSGDRGVVEYIVGNGVDVTEHRWREEKLAFMAAHDPLTGLPNRRVLEDALGRALAHREPSCLKSLLMLDLDHFKLVNDTSGHLAGDQALTAITRLLTAHLRGDDLLVRVGGDEFALLLDVASPGQAQAVAERLRRAVADARLSIGGHTFSLSLSIGLAHLVGQGSPSAVVSQADAALYQAKARGRNRVVVYSPADEADEPSGDAPSAAAIPVGIGEEYADGEPSPIRPAGRGDPTIGLTTVARMPDPGGPWTPDSPSIGRAEGVEHQG